MLKEQSWGSIIIKLIMKKINKFLFWAPRILAIIFILFLAVFSLDIFDMKLDFWGTMLGLFMHNIPVIILTIVLIISWKRELVGAVAFISGGIFYIVRLLITILMNSPHEWYMLFWSVTIAGPAFLVGILFYLNWRAKRKKR
jgi:hypothetical protein